MRFWTAFQHPLRQAALVENGRVLRTIPDHPAKTPARWSEAIGRWDDRHILIGRRNSIELWTADGKDLVQQAYHAWIYGLHVVKRYKDLILVGCAGPDCVFLMDWDSNVKWSWFAHTQQLSAPLTGYPVPFGSGTEWQSFQLTQSFGLPGSTHLNSVNIQPDGTLIATLCHSKTIVQLFPEAPGVTGKVLQKVGRHLPHDFQFDCRGDVAVPVYGCDQGVAREGELIVEVDHVKRITQLGEKDYGVSCEDSCFICDRGGKLRERVVLPRPWHFLPY